MLHGVHPPLLNCRAGTLCWCAACRFSLDGNGAPDTLLGTVALPAVNASQWYGTAGWTGYNDMGAALGPVMQYSVPAWYKDGAQDAVRTGVVQATRSSSEPCVGTNSQDCEVGEWGPWSQCTGNTQTRSRSRPIIAQPIGGGALCGVTTVELPCNARAFRAPACFMGRVAHSNDVYVWLCVVCVCVPVCVCVAQPPLQLWHVMPRTLAFALCPGCRRKCSKPQLSFRTLP